jgi:hypothetical protein
VILVGIEFFFDEKAPLVAGLLSIISNQITAYEG